MTPWQAKETYLNLGPQHPMTQGSFRLLVLTDGEIIRRAIPDIGYGHRSLEKIAEEETYINYSPYPCYVDELSSLGSQWTYALAVETLIGLHVPHRAECLRVIAMELNRISSHLYFLSHLAMSLGIHILQAQATKRQTLLVQFLKDLCGSNLYENYITIGGVSKDLPHPEWTTALSKFLGHLSYFKENYYKMICNNPITFQRLRHIGIISTQEAIDYNLVGPNLRASGVSYDLRRSKPYSIYKELKFDVPIGEKGDALDRLKVRIREIDQSIFILRQCLEKIPQGPISKNTPETIQPDKGEVYIKTENSRGDLGIYLVSDGSTKPYRLKFRTGSFASLAILEKISQGIQIADLTTLVASLDISPGEVDR